MTDLIPVERRALDNIPSIDDPARLRNLIDNARRMGSTAVERAAFARLCHIQPKETPGTVEFDVWKSIFAQEEMKSNEHGKKVLLSRTRQKIARDGEVKTASELALNAKPSPGFVDLIDLGYPDLTFEAVILRHRESFELTVIKAARKRLEEYGINIDSA